MRQTFFTGTYTPAPETGKDKIMRIVVKVGTSTLAYATGCLNIRHVELLVKTLSDLANAGHEIVLVCGTV